MTELKGYKQLVVEVGRLAEDIRSNIYEITTRLVALYQDRDYRADINLGDKACIDYFHRKYLADVGLSYDELELCLEEFPQREQWDSQSLHELYGQAISRKNGRDAAQKEPRKTPTPRPKLADIKKLEESKKDLEVQLDFTNREVKSLRDQLDEALAENSELKQEIARLNGRISELERIAKLEPATS